jgi:hypothetical protein
MAQRNHPRSATAGLTPITSPALYQKPSSTLMRCQPILPKTFWHRREPPAIVALIASAAVTDLLLGQSFLGRFNSWSIDNKRRVLLLGQ